MENHHSDERLERTIGAILRAGVIISTVFVLIGGIGYLWRFGGSRPEYRAFHGEPERLTSVIAIARGAVSLDWLEWIQFGLILLIATPVIRVLFSIPAFVAQRDYTYASITAIVAGVLLYSFLGSR